MLMEKDLKYEKQDHVVRAKGRKFLIGKAKRIVVSMILRTNFLKVVEKKMVDIQHL